MNLKVTGYSSPDVENLWSWSPTLEDVHVLIEFQVEDADSVGGDLFSVMVATPEAIQRHQSSAYVISDRAMIIVAEFNWEKLRNHIEQVVIKCGAGDWSSSVVCLQRYFRWEYE